MASETRAAVPSVLGTDTRGGAHPRVPSLLGLLWRRTHTLTGWERPKGVSSEETHHRTTTAPPHAQAHLQNFAIRLFYYHAGTCAWSMRNIGVFKPPSVLA